MSPTTPLFYYCTNYYSWEDKIPIKLPGWGSSERQGALVVTNKEKMVGDSEIPFTCSFYLRAILLTLILTCTSFLMVVFFSSFSGVILSNTICNYWVCGATYCHWRGASRHPRTSHEHFYLEIACGVHHSQPTEPFNKFEWVSVNLPQQSELIVRRTNVSNDVLTLCQYDWSTEKSWSSSSAKSTW